MFATLYDRHAVAVYRYAAQRVGAAHADDIMSETFLVAFEKRDAFDPQYADARPWLLGIATRLLRKHARVEAVAWKGMVAGLAAEIAPDLIEQAGVRVDAERTTRRLAAALDVPVGTVRSRLNRARRILRRAAGTESTESETDHGRIDPVAQNA